MIHGDVGLEEEGVDPLKISVVNGDLTFEGEALLVGHYRATRLAGTEKVASTKVLSPATFTA